MARRAAKMTQAALALACGWESQSRIGNYEQGKREPTLADLKLIAEAVSVSGYTFEWLTGGQASEPLSGSEKLTHAMRPDAAKMAAAYQAAVIYGDHAKKVLFFTDARHMEFVCALYELLAQGEGVLPGERHAEAMLAFAEQLPQLTGESTNVVPKQQHRTRRR